MLLPRPKYHRAKRTHRPEVQRQAKTPISGSDEAGGVVHMSKRGIGMWHTEVVRRCRPPRRLVDVAQLCYLARDEMQVQSVP
jgi:hypothetical protein